MKTQTVQIIIKTSFNQSYIKIPRQAEILFDGSIKNNFWIWFQKTVTSIGFQLFYMIFCFCFFFNEIGKKNCFDGKQSNYELKTWCQLICNVIMNKYIPKRFSGQVFYIFIKINIFIKIKIILLYLSNLWITF